MKHLIIGKINALLPDLEALAVGLALACSDSLITLAESGPAVTWHSALLLVAGTAGDYLKRAYHAKRAEIAVKVIAAGGGDESESKSESKEEKEGNK